MQATAIPIPLTKAAIRLIPVPILSRLIDALIIKMARRHRKLFKNLSLLAPATIHIDPKDLPHRFALKIEKSQTTLKIITGKEKAPNACIKGTLKSLLDMLEGRVDGDKMFFSREFTFTGNTELVVALRNTLDREEINLIEETTSLLGPFAKPTAKAINLICTSFPRRRESSGERPRARDSFNSHN